MVLRMSGARTRAERWDQWALCQPQELRLGRKDAQLSSRRGRHVDMWAGKVTSVGFVRKLETGFF